MRQKKGGHVSEGGGELKSHDVLVSFLEADDLAFQGLPNRPSFKGEGDFFLSIKGFPGGIEVQGQVDAGLAQVVGMGTDFDGLRCISFEERFTGQYEGCPEGQGTHIMSRKSSSFHKPPYSNIPSYCETRKPSKKVAC